MLYIEWKNIEVYNIAYGRAISIIFTTAFASTIGKSVEHVRFENIRCYGDKVFPDRIYGENEERKVRGVTIKDAYMNGRKQTAENNTFRINAFAENIKFE